MRLEFTKLLCSYAIAGNLYLVLEYIEAGRGLCMFMGIMSYVSYSIVADALDRRYSN